MDRFVQMLGLSSLGLLIVLLAGCDSAATSRAIATQTPIVRASAGGYAALSVTSCTLTTGGGNALADMISTLASQGVIVSASDSAQARLTLNACPFPPDAAVITAVGNAQRQTLGRR